MKISLSFLKKFIPIDRPLNEIAETLTMLGLEVDDIENKETKLDKIVVGKISSIEKHPEAEKLLITKIFDGKNDYQVVCGDTTLKPNTLVAFAKVGASVFDKQSNPIKIEETKIRGVSSSGMLVSAKEMQLFDESDQVLRLPEEEFSTGEDISQKLFDPIFEISLTPNLGHCMSAIGIARELAGALNLKISIPKKEKEKRVLSSDIQVEIDDSNACRKYSAIALDNLEVKESPFWLKKALMECGIRSINNVVDVTNYVMLLFGQPLHAFDLDKLNENKITVRPLKDKEKFFALNENEYELEPSTLVIQDAKKTLAVAGVIGSEESSVKPNTKRALLEAAFFSPEEIRKSSRSLGLKTESSQRFEKGIDYEMISYALNFAASLLSDIANAKVSEEITREPSSLPLKEIVLRKNRVNSIIGHSFSLNEIAIILKQLDLTSHPIDQESIQVKIPSYRNDLNDEIDLIEEVLRIYGINNIERKAPFYTSTKIKHPKMFKFEKILRNALTAESLTEVINSDLISLKMATIFKEKDLPDNSYIRVRHSKSEEHSILRPSLLCAILQNIKYNLDRKNTNLSFFEMGKIHFKKGDAFSEQPMCAIALSGNRLDHHFSEEQKSISFFDIKGIVENITKKLNIKSITFTLSKHPNFHPTRQASIFIENNEVGVIGELNPDLLSQLDIKQRVYYSELNTALLLKHQSPSAKFKPIPTYPGSDRDWTFTINKNYLIQDIFNAIENQKPSILEKVDLISIFESDQIGPDKKNITLRFYYRDSKQTLSYEETEEKHNLLKANVASCLKIAVDI